MTVAAQPLEWHPAYDGNPWLLDWLNDRGPFAGRDTIKVARPMSRRFPLIRSDALHPVDPIPEPFVLTRRRAWGRAPYVGEPFHYEWWVGEDQLRRRIAGETQIVHH